MMAMEKYKKSIESRLQELNSRMRDVDQALDEPTDADLGDQAIQLEDDEVLEGLGQASQREVRLLEDALHRIAEGTYGVCMKCGEQIAEARLEAVPYAPLCRDCAGAGKR